MERTGAVGREISEIPHSPHENGPFLIHAHRANDQPFAVGDQPPGDAVVLEDPIPIPEVHDSAVVLRDGEILACRIVLLWCVVPEKGHALLPVRLREQEERYEMKKDNSGAHRKEEHDPTSV